MINETHEAYAEEMGELPAPTDEERAFVKTTLARVLAEQELL